ncbi:MAG: antitoxin YezG family protein [Streptococcaceae bacterium]|nr:antitoxin YezG family protein [Streptococcaceae bacterium]
MVYQQNLIKWEELQAATVQDIFSIMKTDIEDLKEFKLLASFDKYGSAHIPFYFKTKSNDNWIYYLDDERGKRNASVRTDILRDFWEATKELGLEEWHTLVLYIDENNIPRLEFGYVDWSEHLHGGNDLLNYFEYKYLDVEPKTEETKNIIQEMKKLEDKQ